MIGRSLRLDPPSGGPEEGVGSGLREQGGRPVDRDAAITVLSDVAREEIRRGRGGEVSVLVRDETGRDLFTTSLTLTARWLVDTA